MNNKCRVQHARGRRGEGGLARSPAAASASIRVCADEACATTRTTRDQTLGPDQGGRRVPAADIKAHVGSWESAEQHSWRWVPCPRKRTASWPFWAWRHEGKGGRGDSHGARDRFISSRPGRRPKALAGRFPRQGARRGSVKGDPCLVHSLFAPLRATGMPWARHPWGARGDGRCPGARVRPHCGSHCRPIQIQKF